MSKMFSGSSGSSTGSWAELQLPCCPSKQGGLPEKHVRKHFPQPAAPDCTTLPLVSFDLFSANLRRTKTPRAVGEEGNSSSNQLSPDHQHKSSHRMSWHWEEGALAVPLNRINSLSTGKVGSQVESTQVNSSPDSSQIF